MKAEYSVTGRDLAKAIVADLNSGDPRRVRKARKAAPATLADRSTAASAR